MKERRPRIASFDGAAAARHIEGSMLGRGILHHIFSAARQLWCTVRGTDLSQQVLDRYLAGHDFNGHSVLGLDADLVVTLISARRLDLVRGDMHPNPHIKAFPEEPVDVQLRKLNDDGIGHGCLYPSREFLAEKKAGDAFADQPYSKELALGAAQLEFRVFDLRLLEFYRNDPRFSYEVDDVMGSIYRKYEHREETPATVSDGLEMTRFGFAYNDAGDRAVAMFLRDLHGCTPDEQRLMATYQLKGDYGLHPGFYSSAVLGEWPDRVSIYDAFLEEKKHINAICAKMSKPPLFKNDATHPRPHGFGILLRPTNKEFRDFALQLNILLTDDINPDFFEGDIPVTEPVTDAEGKIRNNRIGTITLLERWLSPTRFRPANEDELKAMFKKLRNIRNIRARPAHIAEDNTFDQVFVHQQRDLINDAFDVVRDLRMMLGNHPKARGHQVPEYLRKGLVWTQ